VRRLFRVLISELNSGAKSVQGSYQWRVAAQAPEQASKETFVVDEELEVGLWRLNVWLEDFIYVYYLECVCNSESQSVETAIALY
jgi:hypothetical protein